MTEYVGRRYLDGATVVTVIGIANGATGMYWVLDPVTGPRLMRKTDLERCSPATEPS